MATKGILSKKEEITAEIHNIIHIVEVVLPFVNSNNNEAKSLITPDSEIPPTTINKPIKNIIVLHSTLLIISLGS